MRHSLAGQKVAILGLGRSGVAAAKLAIAREASVYASDSSDTPETREAAAAVREAGGAADVGGHDVKRISKCDRIVLSPGIPPDVPVLAEEALAGIPVVAEVEFAFALLSAPVIAITGTNGKTTVTGLIAHILEAAGRDAPAAGNIGVALSEIALRTPPPEVAVVEVSSFQLGMTVTFRPRIGVLTNLSPDHLDRYGSVEAYYADKARLFQTASDRSRWVLNAEDDAVRSMAEPHPGMRYWFGIDRQPEENELGAWRSGDGTLVLRTEPGQDEALVHEGDLKILGPHNVANALAAALAARLAGAPVSAIRSALPTFQPQAHRLEPIGEYDGVLWINDSKATNVAATRVAVRGMTRRTILLLGGKDKGEDFAQLAREMAGRIRKVIAFGEAGGRIASELSGSCPVVHEERDLAAVVERARQIAEHGDAVLLSPACSSHDMFSDFEERGQTFTDLARKGKS